MSQRLQKAVYSALEAGYQLDKEAFNFLEKLSITENPMTIIEKAVKKAKTLPQKPLFINRNFLEELLTEETKKPTPTVVSMPTPPLETKKTAFQPYAEDIDPNIEVIEDPTKKICTTGSVEDYLGYFRDRFRRLEKILRQRIDIKGAMPISEALKTSKNSKIKVIGMITDKRESKKNIFFRIEDMNAAATVFVSQGLEESTRAKVHTLLLDQVVCVIAVKSRNDLLVLEDVLFPETPKRTPHKASIPVYAALISDLHIGSKLFMREEFNRFLLWLNGKLGNTYQRELAGKIKYLIIAGDIVDGIGVYPGQADELAINDLYQQYSAASKFIEQIPDYIEVVLVPGNHDASRKALPQPAIPKESAETIYEARKVHSLGNPSTISLHDVELLVYHGRSLDDIIATAPNQSFREPEKAMKLLLQCRHLAPVYGQKTPISPESRDFLVIDRAPDVFHAGHVHVERHETYRGVLLVNSGAWQEQTSFQKKMGVEPTPGIVPIVNLQTQQVFTVNFRSTSMN
ncbi:MAG: DNA-directed DNA polymerase II small subunit [Candidatus Bathyarchaeota archaeon]